MGSTTFEMPHLAPPPKGHHHIPHHNSACPSSMPASDRFRPALPERLPLTERPPPNVHVYHFDSSSYAHAQPSARPSRPQVPSNGPSNPICSTAAPAQPAPQRQPSSSQQPTRYPTPAADKSLIFHSMEVPECISPRGGNLAHFMAEVTSFLWFESPSTIDAAEKMRSHPPSNPIPRLAPNAISPAAFKNWASSVVSTTQIARNVVILSLLYIYRLKKRMSNIRGLLGSEYRLLTVAMMLGNKFLDDNTYTNKTWADVTGLGVGDIHLMEVEFLGNVRYNLLVSAKQWQEWLGKLASIREYMDLAQRSPSPSPSPLLIPSPARPTLDRSFGSSFSSALDASNVYAPQQARSKHSPSFGPYPGANGVTSWPSPFPANTAISPLALKPEHHLQRKRSFPEDDPAEPPAKRVGRVGPEQSMPQYPQHQHQHQPQQAQPQSGLSRMAATMPNLTVNTNNTSHPAAAIGTTQSFVQSVYAPAQASPLSLPPLVSGARAMSTVYPPTASAVTTYAPPQSVTATCGSSMASTPQTVTPTASFPPMSYGTPTKRLSPQHALASNTPYPGSSPLVDSYGHHAGTPVGNLGSTSGVHTPISHSPSIYLQHRNSPYKPIRGVNTLLIPPPAAFLSQYHFSNTLTPSHLHYQPIGRRNEYRTGIVPEYTMSHSSEQHNGLPSVQYQQHQQQQQQVLPNPNQNRGSQQPYMTSNGRPEQQLAYQQPQY